VKRDFVKCSISMCNRIKKLDIMFNNCTDIDNCISFAKSLTHLNALVINNITDNALRLCGNIIHLNANNNANITTCEPFAKSLQILNANGSSCGITDKGLQSCTKLKILSVQFNTKITTCAPFSDTLQILYVCVSTPITNKNVRRCTNLMCVDVEICEYANSKSDDDNDNDDPICGINYHNINADAIYKSLFSDSY